MTAENTDGKTFDRDLVMNFPMNFVLPDGEVVRCSPNEFNEAFDKAVLDILFRKESK